jgi:hypothetical protein
MTGKGQATKGTDDLSRSLGTWRWRPGRAVPLELIPQELYEDMKRIYGCLRVAREFPERVRGIVWNAVKPGPGTPMTLESAEWQRVGALMTALREEEEQSKRALSEACVWIDALLRTLQPAQMDWSGLWCV